LTKRFHDAFPISVRMRPVSPGPGAKVRLAIGGWNHTRWQRLGNCAHGLSLLVPDILSATDTDSHTYAAAPAVIQRPAIAKEPAAARTTSTLAVTFTDITALSKINFKHASSTHFA